MTPSFRSVAQKIGLVATLAMIPAWTALSNVLTQEAAASRTARFGIVEAYYRPGDARDLDVGWDRIIFEWARFQPDGPDEFNTSVIPDEWLVEARSVGREVVGLLKNTPPWASSSGKLGAPPDGLDLPIDDPLNYWAGFVRQAVAYYGEKWGINHWIIYNEPDIRPGELSSYEFDGDVADYYQMLKVAHMAAKSVNPDAVIHLAGMAWWTDKLANRQPYLKRLLDIAADDADAYDYGFFFDVVTVHTFFGTENVWNVLVETEGILWHYELQKKPIWVDEANARPSVDPYAVLPPDSPYTVTLDQQAAYIVQAAALSLAAGVQRFAIYRLYDDHYQPGVTEPWGLVRFDGSRRPAFETYRMVIRTFADTTYAQWRHSERSSLVTLEQPGRTIYVMWTRTDQPVRFHVAARKSGEIATQVSVYGATSDLKAAAVPGSEGWWFAVTAPGAQPDGSGESLIEGSPVILIVQGAPGSVWIEVGGATWTLR